MCIRDRYTSAVLSADGTAPVTWSIAGGKMPGGLSLSQNGHIYGTPTEAGLFAFTVRAENRAGYDEEDFTVNIAGASGKDTPENPKSEDVTPEPSSADIHPETTSTDKPAVKDVKITQGSARDITSLTIGELASIANSGGMIAAILPEIRTNLEGFYTFESIDCFANVKISADVPTGWTLVWNAFTRGKANALSMEDAEDDNVQFTDTDGGIIITVPENHIVNVSAWLDADMLYAPVLSAVEHGEDIEGVGSSGSGGCNSVESLIAIFIPFALKLRKER